MTFANYLQTALTEVLRSGCGDLDDLNQLCRQGVVNNRNAITRISFMRTYHDCVAASGKKAYVFKKCYKPAQIKLFRDHDVSRIVAEQDEIRRQWEKNRVYLRREVVEAIIDTASEIDCDWNAFEEKFLRLPANPESESLKDWEPMHASLDRDDVCQEDKLRPVHLGEVDFILWWYRQKTGQPESKSSDKSHC
jgi:hypothetical protein